MGGDSLDPAPSFMQCSPGTCHGPTHSFRHQGAEKEQGLPSDNSKSSPGDKPTATAGECWGAGREGCLDGGGGRVSAETRRVRASRPGGVSNTSSSSSRHIIQAPTACWALHGQFHPAPGPPFQIRYWGGPRDGALLLGVWGGGDRRTQTRRAGCPGHRHQPERTGPAMVSTVPSD